MIDDIPLHLLRTLLGFALGGAFGFVARRWRFCTLGAIEDAVYSNDTRRLRSWILAIGVAIVGVHALELWADLDLSRSIYTGARIEWGGLVIGGFLFGLGMAMNGTCGLGTLRQLGGGDLKALVTFLVMAVVAMMTMRGLSGLLRIALVDPLTFDLGNSASQRLPAMLGLKGTTASLLAVGVGAAIAVAVFAHAPFRRTWRFAVTGALVGVIVVLGWWATGIAGFDAFDTRRIESFTFVAPLGDTLLYFMLSTALQPDFPIGAVLGVVAGSFLAAKTDGTFRWEIFPHSRDMKRRVAGAVLMGFGGITALGCTIGQGVTGVSTLSIGSMLAIVSIVAGARFGLWWLIERSQSARRPRMGRAMAATAGKGVAHTRVSCTEP